MILFLQFIVPAEATPVKAKVPVPVMLAYPETEPFIKPPPTPVATEAPIAPKSIFTVPFVGVSVNVIVLVVVVKVSHIYVTITIYRPIGILPIDANVVEVIPTEVCPLVTSLQ